MITAKQQDAHPLPPAAGGDQAPRLPPQPLKGRPGPCTCNAFTCIGLLQPHTHPPDIMSHAYFPDQEIKAQKEKWAAQGWTAARRQSWEWNPGWSEAGCLQGTKGTHQSCLSDLVLGYAIYGPVSMFLQREGFIRRMCLFWARTHYQ